MATKTGRRFWDYVTRLGWWKGPAADDYVEVTVTDPLPVTLAALGLTDASGNPTPGSAAAGMLLLLARIAESQDQLLIELQRLNVQLSLVTEEEVGVGEVG